MNLSSIASIFLLKALLILLICFKFQDFDHVMHQQAIPIGEILASNCQVKSNK